MLTDAYGGVGGWVKKLGNAYGCLRWGRWGGLKTRKCLRMLTGGDGWVGL